MVATKKKRVEAVVAGIGDAGLQALLAKPSVRAFLSDQVAQSDLEVRRGPSSTGWDHGNETKREGIKDLNAALHALADIALA